jgi:hypothetical protein
VPMADDPAQISADLRASAARFGQSALEGFLREDYPLFFLHGATASEQIGKAVLAATNPTLIVDPRSAESLLYAAGAVARPPRVRTISVTDVLDRLVRMAPSLSEFRDHVTLLAEVRNGVIHVGQDVEAAVARRVLVPFIRFADACVARLGEEPESFWPESLLGQRRHWLSESEESEKLRLQEQIAAARLRFEERFGSFPEAEREAIAELLIEGADVYGEEAQRVLCPACSSWAVLHGTITVEGEPEYDREGGVESVSYNGEFTPDSLKCPACGLELTGFTDVLGVRVDYDDRVELSDHFLQAYFYEPEESWR